MQAGFYQAIFEKHGIEIALPSVEEQNRIHEKYVGELVAGRFLPETREGLLVIAKKMRDEKHIDALILGGTELPLLLSNGAQIGIPLLDTTRIHVQAGVNQVFS